MDVRTSAHDGGGGRKGEVQGKRVDEGAIEQEPRMEFARGISLFLPPAVFSAARRDSGSVPGICG